MNEIPSTSFILALISFLSVVPESEARGGKGAKGAGGGATRYGHTNLQNSAAYEMTWEDIVLAMQLSAMCFGALIALCIVACCAYKFWGPADEEDFRGRYRSAFKEVSKPTPEFLREVYTLPTTTLSSTLQTSTEKKEGLPPASPPMANANFHKHNMSGRAIFGTSVSADPQQQRPLPPPPGPPCMPNGRAVFDDFPRGLADGGGGGCLSLGNVLEHRSRAAAMSSLSSSRLMNDVRRPGVAPRLAAHLNNSTLDLTHPPTAVYMPNLNASSRSLYDQYTAVV